MNITEVILYSILAIVAILCLINLIRNTEQDDTIMPPKSVWMSSINEYTAQEVFDWVVYITKVGGRRYLEQLAWDHKTQHDFLLSDLQTVLQTKTQDELLEHLRLVAKDFNLDPAIVDAPY